MYFAYAHIPAIMHLAGGGRVLVFGFATPSCGALPQWAAKQRKAGINFLPDLSPRTLKTIAREVQAIKCTGDIVIASIHWGSNLGYRIAAAEREFAHALIEHADIDLVHGHSASSTAHRGLPQPLDSVRMWRLSERL